MGKNKNIRPMSEHPDVNKRVKIYFNNTAIKQNGWHDGIWNGEIWLLRKLYTKNEYVAAPEHIIITGWEDLNLPEKAYEL